MKEIGPRIFGTRPPYKFYRPIDMTKEEMAQT